MDIVVNRIPNAISIPAKALFTRDGKPMVYVASQGHYRPVEVEVQARNPDEVAITGVPAGASGAGGSREKGPEEMKTAHRHVAGRGPGAWARSRRARCGWCAATSTAAGAELPSTRVKKGRVTITVAARGELQGGNSEMLAAPMVGGGRIWPITLLPRCRRNGAATATWWCSSTPRSRNTTCARREADLAEAEQQVIQAEAESAGDRRGIELGRGSAANADVKIAELEMRRQSDAAGDRAAAERDCARGCAEPAAAGASRISRTRRPRRRRASRSRRRQQNKAQGHGGHCARRSIDSMTLKAKTAGLRERPAEHRT